MLSSALLPIPCISSENWLKSLACVESKGSLSTPAWKEHKHTCYKSGLWLFFQNQETKLWDKYLLGQLETLAGAWHLAGRIRALVILTLIPSCGSSLSLIRTHKHLKIFLTTLLKSSQQSGVGHWMLICWTNDRQEASPTSWFVHSAWSAAKSDRAKSTKQKVINTNICNLRNMGKDVELAMVERGLGDARDSVYVHRGYCSF